MLIFLGVVSMMGAFWLGVLLAMVEAKGHGGWVFCVFAAFISGMLGCLAIAYRCFGGEF